MAIAIKGNDGVLHLHPTGTQTAISGDKTLVLTDTEIVTVYPTADVSQSLKYTEVDEGSTITAD
ncbi:hypothetical protein [Pseudoclavibacter sp. CFCC 11306]|uniref:hypothetical protein n=1 Tax=Pseudoclavibacter sp. CFCC 11306 TaxID=1564493 RepID=UPI0013014A9A|nr:hypothetical protein [Pseudoclavibacter sp. CFCC 11306]KAB1659026.1 hypothetical protein F8O09_05525 [Pseudoclavibacter sp. CFCC 11306]